VTLGSNKQCGHRLSARPKSACVFAAAAAASVRKSTASAVSGVQRFTGPVYYLNVAECQG
jgi:hypothetical protein